MSRKKPFRDLKDYFRTLGLEPTLDERKVRSRYRELVLKHHPDVGGHPERFKEINAAYSKILEFIRKHRHQGKKRDKTTEENRGRKAILAALRMLGFRILGFLDLLLFRIRYRALLKKTSLEDAVNALSHSSSPHLRLIYLRVAVLKGGFSSKAYRRRILRIIADRSFPKDRLVHYLIDRHRF